MSGPDRHSLPMIDALHADVDGEAREVAGHHVGRLQCRRGCSDCCVDELTVFEVEADAIRAHYPELLEQGEPHPAGGCAFLDAEGGCRIYDARPYVCRTQGLPLRWFEEDEQEEIVEQRDICPLNAEGPPLESLPEEACWLIGPTELRLMALQDARELESTQHGSAPTRSVTSPEQRVALRALFSRSRRPA